MALSCAAKSVRESEVLVRDVLTLLGSMLRASVVCVLLAACSEPPECERGPGLAEALARNRQDPAALSRSATELAQATEDATTTEQRAHGSERGTSARGGRRARWPRFL